MKYFPGSELSSCMYITDISVFQTLPNQASISEVPKTLGHTAPKVRVTSLSLLSPKRTGKIMVEAMSSILLIFISNDAI